MCQFLGKMDRFDFFGPNSPNNGLWGRDFKNLSADSESARLRYHACKFSVKTENFEFFGINLGKFPNYVQCLVLITLRVFQRAGWRLKWVGWRWVQGLATPQSNVRGKKGNVNEKINNLNRSPFWIRFVATVNYFWENLKPYFVVVFPCTNPKFPC